MLTTIVDRMHRALTQRYEHLTRYASDMIMILRPDAEIMEANDRAVARVAWSRAWASRWSVSQAFLGRTGP